MGKKENIFGWIYIIIFSIMFLSTIIKNTTMFIASVIAILILSFMYVLSFLYADIIKIR